MTKIIKSPTSELFHIKAVSPYWDLNTDSFSDESPYRIIAARPEMSLEEFGVAVLDAFAFDYDHMFGFYNNVNSYLKSKARFEHPQWIEGQEEWDDFGGIPNLGKSLRIDDNPISDIFTRKGKKWLMLFDYGDEWNFWLTLEKRTTIELGVEYPIVIESKYDAPEQYPDYDYDEDEEDMK